MEDPSKPQRPASRKREVPEAQRVGTAAATLGLLNQAHALMSGWVLQFDREEIDALFAPLYEKLDQV